MATTTEKTIKPWLFYTIMVVILIVSAFLGYAINRWMMSYDPSKTMMYVGIGVLIGIIIDVIVWYFIKDKIDWPVAPRVLPHPSVTVAPVAPVSINTEDSTARFMRNVY